MWRLKEKIMSLGHIFVLKTHSCNITVFLSFQINLKYLKYEDKVEELCYF